MKNLIRSLMILLFVFNDSAIAAHTICPTKEEIKGAKLISVKHNPNPTVAWFVYSEPFFANEKTWYIVISNNKDFALTSENQVLQNTQRYLRENEVWPHTGPINEDNNVIRCGYMMSDFLLYVNTFASAS